MRDKNLMKNIRNFCIIAHIDHGKSTLADRLLELTGTVDARRMRSQYLDSMELERERGITIKMAPVRMLYRKEVGLPKFSAGSPTSSASAQVEYVLNLIDTPGHSDFSYEVSRALAAVEGGILLVDGMQGIQAQTVSNFELARAAGLKLLGAINKVDLFRDRAELDALKREMGNMLGVSPGEILMVSGKTGEGVPELLREIVKRVPPPSSKGMGMKRALIFDSFYDEHRGVVASVRIADGSWADGERARLLATSSVFKIKEVGYFLPETTRQEELLAGEIGYVATGIKDPGCIRIGDTLAGEQVKGAPLPGYQEPEPRVFVSLYPEDSDEYDALKQALQKLHLNDAALSIAEDRNELLGRGFRIGFLGKLHYEITAERIEKEFGIALTHTYPSVMHRVKVGDRWEEVETADAVPIKAEIEEPIANVRIVLPPEYVRVLGALKQQFRMGTPHTEVSGNRLYVRVRMPLTELISDFEGKLKSVTEGYGSFSYELAGYEAADVVRVDVRIAGERVPGLSRIIHRGKAEREARKFAERLKEVLPRKQYAQAIQVLADGEIVAREDVPALKKDVTGYLYGGDRTRKMKLWQKQKEGKKRLKARGGAKLSTDVFRKLLEE